MDPTKVSIAVAFDAHVLKWSLDNNPPDEYARHHIKEASIYGHNVWTADFAATCFAGEALHWFETLAPEVQGNWSLLRPAMLEHYRSYVRFPDLYLRKVFNWSF